jgi:putative proteasome-type protease
MTYCVGLSLERGLVFASDSRTNAGVDYVTTYSKMHVFTPAPDRLFVIMSAGNLATTQEVINHIQRDIDYPTGSVNLTNVKYLFEAAEYVGKISQQVQQEHSVAFNLTGVSGETTLILGGQISGKPHGLIMIYPQGNYITSSPQTPYLQIGESKYGKPALDRISHPGLSLHEGARLTLVSLDATARSNITVGPPFEVAIYQKDSFKLRCRCSFAESDPYLMSVREAWNTGINNVFQNLPEFQTNAGTQSVIDFPTPQAQAQAQTSTQSQTHTQQPSQSDITTQPQQGNMYTTDQSS